MSARITLKSKPDPNASPARKPAPVIDYDPNTREIWKNGVRVGFLSPQSASFLNLLLAKNGQVASHDELISAIWPDESERPFTTGERIRELVGDLRQTLGDTRKERIFIENVPRVGYRFIGQIENTVSPQPVPPPVTEVSENPPPSIPSTTDTRTTNGPRRWAIAATIAALSLLTTAAVLSRKFAVSDPGQLKSEFLWHGPAAFRFGEVSRDGRFLCYADPQTEDLQVRDLTKGTTITLSSRPLKAKSGGVRECVFSDDGQWIAFRRDMGEAQSVYVSSSWRPGDRLLYTDQDNKFRLTDWSPDGASLTAITCSSNSGGEILLLDTKTGAVSSKHVTEHCPTTAKFSPDNRLIAHDSGVEANRLRQLLVVAKNGSSRTVSSEPGIGRLIDWSQDGSGLLYSGGGSNRAETEIRYVALTPDLSSEPAKILVADSPFTRILGLAGDSMLYFVNSGSSRDIHIADLDVDNNRLIRPPSVFREDRRHSEGLFDWSPNGKIICAVSFDDGLSARAETSVVKIIEGSISRRIELTGSILGITAVHWTPDGKSVLVSRSQESGSSIDRINPLSGQITGIRHSSDWAAYLHDAVQSPFNGAIYYKLRVGQREPSPLFRMSTENPAEDREVLPSVYSYRLSADGRQLVYSTFDEEFEYIRLVDLSTSKTRELHREPREGRIVSVALTPDSRHVLFSKRGQLWKISTAGGKPQMLPLNMPVMRDLNLHPNGTTLAFLAGEADAGDLWVMKNILPKQQKAAAGNSVF